MLKLTKISLILVLAVLVAGVALAERGDDSGRKSKNGHAEGTIDGVNVVVDYGRPSANGRDIWGGLVPLGKVWRTGADEATTITFDKDVTVEGTKVPAGTYALFTRPGEKESSIIFNSVAEQWGAFDHKADMDVATVNVANAASEHVETFEISVGDAAVTLSWAETSMSFAVAAD